MIQSCELDCYGRDCEVTAITQIKNDIKILTDNMHFYIFFGYLGEIITDLLSFMIISIPIYYGFIIIY